jgi:hypothetical protein
MMLYRYRFKLALPSGQTLDITVHHCVPRHTYLIWQKALKTVKKCFSNDEKRCGTVKNGNVTMMMDGVSPWVRMTGKR